MFTPQIALSAIIFGIFLVACFKILYQHSVVNGVLTLAEDDEVNQHLPKNHVNNHSTFIEKSKVMLTKYWVIWYPVITLGGSAYAYFMTLLVASTADHSLALVAFLSLTFASAIMKGLIAPFPPEWFAEWGVDLALIKNQLLINRAQDNITKLAIDQSKSAEFKQFAIEQYNIIISDLQRERQLILEIKNASE